MNIIEAGESMDEGKKVRRPDMDEGQSLGDFGGDVYDFFGGPNGSWRFSIEDILAGDWGVVE